MRTTTLVNCMPPRRRNRATNMRSSEDSEEFFPFAEAHKMMHIGIAKPTAYAAPRVHADSPTNEMANAAQLIAETR